MTIYTIQLPDGSWPEHVGETLFHGELPCIGHEIMITGDPIACPVRFHFRVLSVDHHATMQHTGTYATKVVVVVERAR
jgi:hypothetical protein